VPQPCDFEARLAALEARVEAAAADATAARHLAAARDRDLADLGVKVDANRSAINALGEQTAARFVRLEQQVDNGSQWCSHMCDDFWRGTRDEHLIEIPLIPRTRSAPTQCGG
jgi:hypothetical protein